MADIAIFRINYKSDFILTLNSDAGWATPFCIKFWTGAPSQAYFIGFDGTTYTHCAPVEDEPTKLVVQFDDHHLPIGDLKFQIGYHFTVADFPTTVEDEVLNKASVIIEQNGEPAQVMLDFTGETAPEIEFSLPAYANEAQRIANEEQRISNEAKRIENEQQRIANEEQRIENEQARISAENERISNEDARIAEEQVRVSQEAARVSEFAQLKADAQEVTADANAAAQLANEKAAEAQQKAVYAQTQGDYAKAQGDIAQADHQRAESDHTTATADHTQADTDHNRAESDHTRAESDHEAVEVYVDSLGAFDISAYHATGGVLAKYADLAAALGTDGANIPYAIRKGGMSVKFVLSSDNKYVQFRLMADEFTTDTTQWAIADESIYVYNSEFVYVKTDAEGKILFGIKMDGEPFFGVGCPEQVIDYITEHFADYDDIKTFLGDLITEDTLANLLNDKVDKVEGKSLIDSDIADNVSYINAPKYLDAKTDKDGKILEDITAEGIKEIHIPTTIDGATLRNIDSKDWVRVVTDHDNKILGGFKRNGKFAATAGVEGAENSSKLQIALLDANFASPIQPTIYDSNWNEDNSVKGLPSAKYLFDLPLKNDAFNIRFKFKIVENLLNQNKSAVIAKLGNANLLSAASTKLYQYTSTAVYDGQTKTMNWNCLNGGLSLNGIPVVREHTNGFNQNLGEFAFGILYTGNSTDVTIENDGEKLVITIDNVANTFLYSQYQTMYSLYKAIEALSDVTLEFKSIEGRIPTELAVFEPISLVNTYYTLLNGEKSGELTEYVDSSYFYLPYAVNEDWHQVEVAKIGGNVYVACDGWVTTISPNGGKLLLGGDCDVLFKELEVSYDSADDAEYNSDKNVIISSVNPYIIYLEGHGLDNVLEDDEDNANNASVDRYSYIFEYLKSNGYVPISIHDASEFMNGNKRLPKRCYTIIFDDYRFKICMDNRYRKVFTQYGVKPTLAIIQGYSETAGWDIYHNGQVITIQEAAAICKLHNFDLVSHTVDHVNLAAYKPSEYLGLLLAQVYDGDIKGIDSMILVYPYGRYSMYMLDVEKWWGFKLGFTVTISGGKYYFARNKFILFRVDTGSSVALQDIVNEII